MPIVSHDDDDDGSIRSPSPRNHRERKANYIKALEAEVVNLRKQNQQNIFTLETEISTLRQHLLNYGFDPPARLAKVR